MHTALIYGTPDRNFSHVSILIYFSMEAPCMKGDMELTNMTTHRH